MTIAFTIPGVPRGKGRPKFARIGSGVRAYTPAETAAYENLVRMAFDVRAGYTPIPKDASVQLDVTAHFPVPKSRPKRFHAAAQLEQSVPHVQKPDMDNIIKAVLDGLNGVAFRDDAQVQRISAAKWYSHAPRLEVSLTYNHPVEVEAL